MTEKVYLITGAELSAHSKEKILLALDWAETNLQAHPDVAFPELLQYLRDNIDSVVNGEEEWSYGTTVKSDLNVVEVEETQPVEEPVMVASDVDDYEYDDEIVDEPEVVDETELESYSYDDEEEVEEDSLAESSTSDVEEVTEDSYVEEVAEPVEPPVVVNVYAIDVENTILEILNRGGETIVNDLVDELAKKYTQELIAEGYWNLVNSNTISTDETTGVVEIIKYESGASHTPEEPETPEEEVVIEEEETDFFSAPAISRQKQYQGLLREAGQIDR